MRYSYVTGEDGFYGDVLETLERFQPEESVELALQVERSLESLFGPTCVSGFDGEEEGMVRVIFSQDQAKLFVRVLREVEKQVLGESDE
jgi:hypothetical protein